MIAGLKASYTAFSIPQTSGRYAYAAHAYKPDYVNTMARALLLLLLIGLPETLRAQAPQKCLSLAAAIDSTSIAGWQLQTSGGLRFVDPSNSDRATVYLNNSGQPGAYDCTVSGIRYIKALIFPWQAITQEAGQFLDMYYGMPACPGNPGPMHRPCLLEVYELIQTIEANQ